MCCLARIEDSSIVMASFSFPEKDVKELHPELQAALMEARTVKNFQPDEFVRTRVGQFLHYMKKNNLKAAVVSISGGVDSSCVLGLLKRAQEIAASDPAHPFNPANGGKIVPIAQPINSTPEIQSRAYEAATAFGIDVLTVDQTDIHQQLVTAVESQIGELQGFSKSMFKSYQRTPVAYLVASHFGGVVVGTGNLDEDGYLYYYCKFGDGAVDVGLIWDIHKSEVFAVASYLGVPESILSAPPSADLAPGQLDEAEIGATYSMVELVYIYLFKFDEVKRETFKSSLCKAAKDQFDHEFQIIQKIHEKGLHKADLNPKNMGSPWYYENYPEG